MHGAIKRAKIGGRLIIRGTGPSRSVYHPDGITQLGTIQQGDDGHWSARLMDGTPVTWRPVRHKSVVVRTEKVMKQWTSCTCWNLSLDDLEW